jgi:predicted nucleotidyltransferase component of viral defense system
VTRGDDPYTTAQALRAALTDRLKTISAASGRSVSQLRRQFAYDRLLARLFTVQPEAWILKGGVALIARVSSARYTGDVDLVARADSPAAGLEAFREAAAHDLADFFSFRLGEPRSLVQGVAGVRVMCQAHLGPRLFEGFGVDLVTGAP